MQNNIVFLDLDGPVIPNYRSKSYGRLLKEYSWFTRFDTQAVDNIIYLLDKFQAKIVTNTSHHMMLSSNENYIHDLFAANGLDKYLLDCSIYYIAKGFSRGKSVDHWLKHNKVTKYVIFDDDTRGYEGALCEDNLVGTRSTINDDYLRQAIKILKK